jgi:hypothetical protein
VDHKVLRLSRVKRLTRDLLDCKVQNDLRVTLVNKVLRLSKENMVLQDQHNCLMLDKVKETLSQQVQEQRIQPVLTGMKKL